MKNFEYYNPVKIYFGKEQIEKLSDILKPYKKILFLYGMGSIKRNGIYNRVINQLENYQYIEFGGIEPNPDYDTLINAVELGRENNVDFILAVGGGSVIDGAKFVAAAIKFNTDNLWEIIAKNKDLEDAVKMGAVLTLPATGTEMNANSVISRKSTNEKLAFGNPLLMPVFSILEPDVVQSLPEKQIINGIVDAYVHVIEQYLTYPVNALVQDKYAESLLKILLEIAPKLQKCKNDYALNANFMWTTTMALNGLIATGVPTDWSTHIIGHELTALYGIDHADTLAIILPGVMRIMKDEKKEKLVQYAQNVFGVKDCSQEEAVDKAIEMTENFFNELGVKTKLKDYGIGEDIVEIIPERFIKRKFVKLGENKTVSPEIVKKILRNRL